MGEKNFEVSLLCDFYGDMLTDRQREVVEYYYSDDLSLQEISEHLRITRQGVRDLIKRSEAALYKAEAQLGLARRFSDIRAQIAAIQDNAKRIGELAARYQYADEVRELAFEINERAANLAETV